MKKVLFIFVLLCTILVGASCNDGPYPYAEGIEKVRKGMTEERIIQIMGEPNYRESVGYSDTTGYYAILLAWFSGASSEEEANEKTNNDIPVYYYYVVVESKDNVTFKYQGDSEAKGKALWGYDV